MAYLATLLMDVWFLLLDELGVKDVARLMLVRPVDPLLFCAILNDSDASYTRSHH